MGKRTDLEKGVSHYSQPAPKPWFSWLVPLIFVVDSAIFAYTMYVNDCPATTEAKNCLFYDHLGRYSFQPLKENPLLGPSITTLTDLGALDRKLVVEKNEGWRLISCMWLHAGLIHLVANMLSLLFIGIRLEQEFGFLRIGLLYVLSGFGGSLMSALHSQGPNPTISVGASGALFGLLGAMLSELITNWTIYANKCTALLSLVIIIGLNLAVGFLPHVDNSAHIGGFLSGFLLGFILLVRPQYGYVSRKQIPPGYDIKRKPRHKCYQHLLWIAALIVLMAGYVTGMTKLYKGQTIKYIPLQSINS
ncbi:Rhomboid domain-containing protein [Cephalotus follicularis]|uniref:RHOMBOID-like protein n=1 Tax=Cephalotus follicularis TaxID=3775 RepID=A0A1Q3BDT3_CEPFO|nr:Rhomboid domain-containing protein [Cephalotus follicularis]